MHINRPTQSMFTINLSRFDMCVCVCARARAITGQGYFMSSNWKTRCYWHWQRPYLRNVSFGSFALALFRMIVTNVRYFADFSFRWNVAFSKKKVLSFRRFSILYWRYWKEIIKICCVKRHHLVRVATHLNFVREPKHFCEKFISSTEHRHKTMHDAWHWRCRRDSDVELILWFGYETEYWTISPWYLCKPEIAHHMMWGLVEFQY